MKHLSLIILLLATTCSLFAQKESADVKSGNNNYKKEKYVEAEVDYRKGLDKNASSFSANYDLGNALFRQEKYAEAADQFKRAAALADGDKKRLADSYHNLGNSLLSAGDIQNSIEAYKQSLRNNPTDDETRYNLAYAKHMLQQQQQQQNQDNQQEQDKQEQQKQEEQQQQQQNQEQQKQEEQQQQQEQQQQMSKENAEQILNALQQDEKDTQEKVKKQQMKQSKRNRVEKNW